MKNIILDFEKLKRKLEIKEWGITIYTTPLTFKERYKIRELSKDESGNSDGCLTSINTIIQKSLDKDGNHHFNSGDVNDLMNKVDSDILIRILEFIMDSSTVKEEKKD